MGWKETAKQELEVIRQLANYVSQDPEATQRLMEIKKQVEIALKAIDQINELQ